MKQYHKRIKINVQMYQSLNHKSLTGLLGNCYKPLKAHGFNHISSTHSLQVQNNKTPVEDKSPHDTQTDGFSRPVSRDLSDLYISRQDTWVELNEMERLDRAEEIVRGQEENIEIDPAEPKFRFTLPRLIALIGPEWCLVLLGMCFVDDGLIGEIAILCSAVNGLVPLMFYFVMGMLLDTLAPSPNPDGTIPEVNPDEVRKITF